MAPLESGTQDRVMKNVLGVEAAAATALMNAFAAKGRMSRDSMAAFALN
jgi:hypothetical protein